MRQRHCLSQYGQFLQAQPAAGQQDFTISHVGWIKQSPIKIAFNSNRFKIRMCDELCDDRIASQVAFRSTEQFVGRKFSGDKAKIQIAFANRFHLFTADVTKIPLITPCHSQS